MVTVKYTEEYEDLAKKFDCGNVYINYTLTSFGTDKYYGTTYVWLNENKSKIIGFYNITCGYVDNVVDGVYYKSGGAFHINDFALDIGFRGIKKDNNTTLADELLIDCLDRIDDIRENVGVMYVTLESTHDGHALYERNGFIDLDEDMHFSPEKKTNECIQMYLPLALEEI